jgi:transposase
MTERVIEMVPGLVRGHKSDGRCVYDAQAKRELVKRCQQPGVSVAATAMAHGINANLLRTWILKSSRRNGLAASIAPVMLPVKTRTECKRLNNDSLPI